MIEGKYVNLRALEKEDLELLKKWRNDKRTRTHTREYRLLNMINQREWFETIHKQNPPTHFFPTPEKTTPRVVRPSLNL